MPRSAAPIRCWESPTRQSPRSRCRSGSIRAIPTIYHRYTALADANFEKRDYRQTLHWARQAIALRPDYWYPNALATAALALDGDREHAIKLAGKLKHSLPNATIASIRTIMYFSDGFWERLSEGLALAGSRTSERMAHGPLLHGRP